VTSCLAVALSPATIITIRNTGSVPMLADCYRRIVAATVLTSYVLASTLSGIMHNHGESPCCDAPSAVCATHGCATKSHAAHDREHHHHHHHDDGQKTKSGDTARTDVASTALQPAASSNRSAHLHDANCAACQFLSQHAAPVALASAAVSSETPSLLAWTAAIVLPADVPHAFDARGPPVNA